MRLFRKLFAAAIALLLWFAPGSASAQSADCTPYCDFNHYYGPQDFTWVRPGGYGPQQSIYVRPGLFAYPRCGPSGYCSPYLVSSGQRYRVRVTVRRFGPAARIHP